MRTKCIGTIGRMFSSSINPLFTDSLVELCLYSQANLCKENEFINYQKSPVSWHEMGRNFLVDKTLGDWLFSLDTDHCFSPDILERLLRLMKRENASVISGIYQYKKPPHSPVANLWIDDKLTPIINWDRNIDILDVGSVGAGCLLVKREVFNKIKRETGKNPFDILPNLSEDYSFCKRLKDLHISILLATKVECHHIIDNVLYIDDYKPPVEGSKIIQSANGIVLE